MRQCNVDLKDLEKIRLKPSPHQAVLHRQIDRQIAAMERARQRVRIINPPLPN